MSRLAAGLLLFAMGLAGCTSSDTELRVFVAASLVDVAREWQADASARQIEFAIHSGGSLLLARQIAAGARADVLLAAGPSVLDLLDFESAPLRVDSALLVNRLVIVSRRGAAPPVELSDLVDARFKRIAVADPRFAPAGVYTQRLLEAAGLWSALAPRVITTGDVRTALAAASTGAADAAFVYATDAATQPELAVTEIESYDVAVAYPFIMLPPETPAKAALWDYVHSDRARAIARRHGFGA